MQALHDRKADGIDEGEVFVGVLPNDLIGSAFIRLGRPNDTRVAGENEVERRRGGISTDAGEEQGVRLGHDVGGGVGVRVFLTQPTRRRAGLGMLGIMGIADREVGRRINENAFTHGMDSTRTTGCCLGFLAASFRWSWL